MKPPISHPPLDIGDYGDFVLCQEVIIVEDGNSREFWSKDGVSLGIVHRPTPDASPADYERMTGLRDLMHGVTPEKPKTPLEPEPTTG